MNQTKNQAKRKRRSPWAMLGTIALSQLLLALKNQGQDEVHTNNRSFKIPIGFLLLSTAICFSALISILIYFSFC